MFIAATQLITSCSLPSKNSFMAKDEIKVVENKIYRNNKLFAELRYFDAPDQVSNYHRGVAIYYFPNNTERWIFPAEGWSIRKNEEEYTSVEEVSKLDLIFSRQHKLRTEGKADKPRERIQLLIGGEKPPKPYPACFDVKISSDGKYVFYKTRGIFFNSSHKYLVEYGMPK